MEQDNPYARQLLRVLSSNGQNYLNAVEAALKRPNNQDVVVALFMAIESYFSDIKPGFSDRRDIEAMLQYVKGCIQHPENLSSQLAEIIELVPEQKDKLEAILLLSGYCEELTFPVFGLSDAIGSVMRKRIEHLTSPLKQQLAILRS